MSGTPFKKKDVMQISPSQQKYYAPVVSTKILHRTNLIQALEQTICNDIPDEIEHRPKVILVCAPAGYGKTTLLADFVKQGSHACCWCFFDHTDTDPLQFFEHILMSIYQRFPFFEKNCKDLLAQIRTQVSEISYDPSCYETLIDDLVSLIHRDILEHFILILCNYHIVNKSQQINFLLNHFMRKMPYNLHIIVETRCVPSMDLTFLLLQHRLHRFEYEALRFTPQDIRDLTQILHKTSFSEQEAQQITNTFDGWITGILLGTKIEQLSTLSNHKYEFATFHMSSSNILSYLINEVFKGEQTINTFLRETSLLEQLTPSICNDLLSITDAEEKLKYAEMRGLFVQNRGNERNPIYRISPPILREVLYEDFRAKEQEHVFQLHQRAAKIFSDLRNHDRAIFHALSAYREVEASEYILDFIKHNDLSKHQEMVTQWICRLSSKIINEDPQLLLLQANISIIRRETEKALQLLNVAYDLVTQKSSGIDPIITSSTLGNILISRSITSFTAGNYKQTQQLCQHVLTLLPPDENKLRAEAYQQLGICVALQGDYVDGIQYMQQALQLWGHNPKIHNTARLHGHLANAYNIIGNYSLAEYHRNRAIVLFEQLDDIEGKINNMIGMAFTKRNKGSFEEAISILHETLTMSRDIHFRDGEGYALENLGEVLQDRNLYGQSLESIENAIVIAREIGDHYLCNLALCALAFSYLFMSDVQTASLLLQQVKAKTEVMSNYENLIAELVQGTIWLFQEHYKDAYISLQAVSAKFQQAKLKTLYLHSLFRLIVSQIALGMLDEVKKTLEIAQNSIIEGNYEHIASIEFSRFPSLGQTILHLSSTFTTLSSLCLPVAQTQTYEKVLPCRIEIPDERSLKIQIFAFGEPSVYINGVPVVRWRMSRSLELGLFLLNHRYSMSKERIIDALWTSDIDENLDQTFRSTMHYLRKAIGEACIVKHAGTYQINLASLYGENIIYDVHIFQKQYNEAKKALKCGNEDDASLAFQKMIDLYHGDYVQSFDSQWCILPREELRRYYIDTCKQLAILAWKYEHIDECIHYWQQLITVDNCLEAAHYNLMKCYLRQGKRTLALRQYHSCVEVLEKELNVRPNIEIQKIYQYIIEK